MKSSAIDRLISGFKVFRTRHFEQRPELFANLASKGQNPEVLVIGCSDSRADPAILLDTEPGELFVIRNVANLIPPYQPDGRYHGTSAAVEFAVLDLAVRHVVVLGHSGCGGIKALIDSEESGKLEGREFIANWVSIAGRARAVLAADSVRADPEQECRLVEQASIRVSLENLMTFPWIRRKVRAGELSIHGWWFDLENGGLWGIDAPEAEFKILS
ncbi:MAG: carbonic anhydrase [Alphaproteobacteria bacterium]